MVNFLEDWPIAILLTGLFVVSLTYAGIGFVGNYDKSSEFITSEQFNFTEIEQEIVDTNEASPSWLNTFRKDEPNTFFTGAIIILSVWGFINNILGVTQSLWSIISKGVFDVLGIDPIVLGTVSTVILIMLIVLGWKKIKQGQ